MGGEVAAVVIAAKLRRIVGTFRSAGVTSPATARSLAELGVNGGWLVNRLINRAVLRRAEPDRYYLDEEAWKAFRRARRRRVIIAASIILLFAVGVLLVRMALR